MQIVSATKTNESQNLSLIPEIVLFFTLYYINSTILKLLKLIPGSRDVLATHRLTDANCEWKVI